MVAAAGAGVTAVDHEFLRAEPSAARLVVDDLGLVHELAPIGRRVDIDLDHAGIWRDAEALQAGVAARRRITFDEDRLTELLGGVLDRRDELEIVLGALDRWHENVEMAVARLEGDGGAHDPRRRRTHGGAVAIVGRQGPPPGFAARRLVA